MQIARNFDHPDDSSFIPFFDGFVDDRVIEPMRKAVEDLNPDMIVGDFASHFPHIVADALKLPLVLNLALPLRATATTEIMELMPGLDLSEQVSSCFGCLCICPKGMLIFGSMLLCCRKCCLPKDKKRFNEDEYKTLKNRIVMCNSFFGFDKPMPLPPNMVLTGPLLGESSGLIERMQKNDPEVAKWLDDALEKGDKVMVISLGSVVNLRPWAIDHIMRGVLEVNKTQGLRVLWSLKDEDNTLPDDLDKTIFCVSKWIPQIEALNHPAVVIFFSHMGFGAALEAISSG